MGGQEPKKPKKHICVGLLAHVDAGKTTLSEALLYLAGSIRRLGRVDNRDAFLDTYAPVSYTHLDVYKRQVLIFSRFRWE